MDRTPTPAQTMALVLCFLVASCESTQAGEPTDPQDAGDAASNVGGDTSPTDVAQNVTDLSDLCDPTTGQPCPETYFVSASGDDDNTGSADEPWATVQHAADNLSAGQTVYIRAGTYNEHVQIRVSGRADAWITFTAYPDETVTIDGSGIVLDEDSGLVQIVDQSYVRVVGLKIQNAGPDDNAAGILVSDSSYITIQGNHTYNTTSSGIGVWGGDHIGVEANEVELACNDGEQECITIAGTDNFWVIGNEVHHSGPGGIGGEGIDAKDGASNGVVTGNHVHHVNRLGIYVEAWDKHTFNIDVSHNLVHDNAGDGITLASEMGGLLENVRAFNNIGYDNACSGLSVSIGSDEAPVDTHPLHQIEVFNNTFYANGSNDCSGNPWGGGIGVDNPDIEAVVIRNNILSQNFMWQLAVEANVPTSELTMDHNLIDGYRNELDEELYGAQAITEAPGFVNANARNFHLTEGSAAIDRASAEGAPDTDYEMNSRPQGGGFDVGAFEYVP